MAKRWKHRPEGSNWGDFGNDDEIGRLNLITPEAVRRGIKSVSEGIPFCLSLPLNLPGGGSDATRFGPRLFATGSHDHPHMNHALEHEYPGATDILCDDAVTMALQYSTQWDGLSHMGYRFDADGDGTAEVVYYNGWRGGEDICQHEQGGAQRLGIETYAAACIQTRGILIDFQHHFGLERRVIGFEDLMHVIAADNIQVESGDIICLHSGYSQVIYDMAGQPDHRRLRKIGAELDGSDAKLLQWITDSNIAAIAADTVAVETFRRPSEGQLQVLMPLHEHCLFKLGLPLAEYWWLTPLAEALRARGRHEFLLTAPPLRLPGAVGSPVSPVATI
jgi:kynurenine formamidase